MYCTVHIQTEKSGMTLDNYGCTLPAMVRRRRPQPQPQEAAKPEVAEAISTTPAPAPAPVPTTQAPTPSSASTSNEESYDILNYPYEKAIKSIKATNEDENALNDIDSEPKQKPKRHVVYMRQPIRVAIPAQNYYYQSRPYYVAASQPIVYRFQPQYQPYYHHQQPYYRTIAY